jgi:AraC family transcriptional regulator
MKNHSKIEIKELPEIHLASVLSIGVQNIETAYNKLISWATYKNLFPKENMKMITVYHDSFKDTAPDKVKIHACMLLDEPLKLNGEIFSETLPNGKYIVSRQEITLQEFEKAWQSLFLWMNENGYQYKRTFPFEIYHNNFKEHPEKKCRVDFCIPIL